MGLSQLLVLRFNRYLWMIVPCDVCRTQVRFCRRRVIQVQVLMPIPISRRYEYLWEDGVKYKRPTKLPAPEYVDALMNWAQGILDDERVFPNQIGMPLSHEHCISTHAFMISSRRCTFPSELPRHCAYVVPAAVPRIRPLVQQPLRPYMCAGY